MKKLLFIILCLTALLSTSFGQCIVGNANAPQTDDPNQRIGQSFRATCPGIIEYVELFCSETGTNVGGTLEIFNGSTVLGTPIHTQSYPPTAVVAGEALRIYLTEPLTVANFDQRTFELDMSLAIPFSGGNPYSGGRLFYGGTNSSTYAQSDLKFNVSILSNCDESTASITEEACVEYISPSGLFWMDSGIFMDTIPNMAGCDSVITVDLTIFPVDTVVNLNGAELMASASDASYQWVDCDNGFSAIPGAIEQSFVPTTNGSYSVIVTQGLCSDTSGCHLVLSTDVQDPRLPGGSMFPNPSSGIIQFAPGTFYTLAEVFDSQGDRVLAIPPRGRTVDLSTLPNGVYFIRLHGPEARPTVQRVTLQR